MNSSELSKPRLHLPYIDGMRALAALYVLVHHAYLTVWSGQPTGYESIPRSFYLFGHFAVSWFIVISGFCLMLPVMRRAEFRIGRFYWGRIRRILPPYYAALGVSVLLAMTVLRHKTGTHWDISIPVTDRGIVRHLLLIHNWGNTAGQINHAFWSIATECQIYVLFPLLVLVWRRAGIGASTLIALALGWGLASVLRSPRFDAVSPHYIGLFGLGMAGAWIAFQGHERLPWFALSCVVLLVMGVMCGRHSFIAAGRYPHLPDLGVGIAAMAMLIAGVKSPSHPAIRFLNWKPLAFIGTFSYSIYLMHAPLLQLVWQLLRPLRLSPAAQFAMLSGPGAGVIVAASWLFYRVCERPYTTVERKQAADTDAGGVM